MCFLIFDPRYLFPITQIPPTLAAEPESGETAIYIIIRCTSQLTLSVEIALSLERGLASAAGGYDSLTVGGVGTVAGGKDALDIGAW